MSKQLLQRQQAALIARIELLESLSIREYQQHVREVAERKQALSIVTTQLKSL